MAKEGRLSVGSACDTFPIVAIGASAGGIRALGQFFDAVPPDIRMAFVVVLHLHATTTSHVADVLATHTALPTVEVTKPTRVVAGQVFVIAANRALTIRGGVQPGFNGSSQRLREPTVAPRQRPRQVFSSRGSCEAWH